MAPPSLPSSGGGGKSGSQMRGKRPRQVTSPHTTTKDPKQQVETPAEMNQDQVQEKITVSINANLLQCCVCLGPLTPPLFQCTKGNISCSRCCTEVNQDDEVKAATVTRCRGLEHVLAGLHVPCPFQQHGCTEMILYASVQAHKASCAHAPFHCPISGCAGYAGRPLREHVRQDHPDVERSVSVISPRLPTPLTMRADEQARVVRLGFGNRDDGAEFLIVVGRYKQLGRALSVARLTDESLDELDFKYRIEVTGNAGALSLSGSTQNAERLAEPYKASPFLFVPNETWDSPEGTRVFIELK